MKRIFSIVFAEVIALGMALQLFGAVAAQAQPVYVSIGGRTNCEMIVNGRDVGGCISSFAAPLELGREIYIFAIGRDAFPYSYNVNTNRWALITNRTQIQRINQVYVDRNGMVMLAVEGTGGSFYSISANVFAGRQQQQPQRSSCRILQTRDSMGRIEFRVIDRNSRTVAIVYDGAQARRITMTDMACR